MDWILGLVHISTTYAVHLDVVNCFGLILCIFIKSGLIKLGSHQTRYYYDTPRLTPAHSVLENCQIGTKRGWSGCFWASTVEIGRRCLLLPTAPRPAPTLPCFMPTMPRQCPDVPRQSPGAATFELRFTPINPNPSRLTPFCHDRAPIQPDHASASPRSAATTLRRRPDQPPIHPGWYKRGNFTACFIALCMSFKHRFKIPPRLTLCRWLLFPLHYLVMVNNLLIYCTFYFLTLRN